MTQKTITVTEKHSFPLRFLHWNNVFLLSLMIWSGVLIYWANQAYFKIPPTIAHDLHIEYSLARGMGWHFLIMWPFALNGLAYVIYLFVSGHWRMLVPLKHSLKEVILVVLHDFKIIKIAPPNIGKYNAAQRIAYSGAIVMGAGTLITGLAIYKPVQVGWLTFILGGYEAARLEHFILTMGLVFFIIIHVLQVLKTGWNNFRAMIAGYEIEKN
jgi:thiosulfate reductase cytochrome b subunit